MLWVKSFHIVFMVTWFAGLFYLPRLFVYHSLATDSVGIERFKLMERKLYFGIMTPGAVLTNSRGVHGEKADEYAFMAILMLNNRMPRIMNNQSRTRWEQPFSSSATGKTLLVVGVGHIGGGAAKWAKRFGMTVLGIRRTGRPHRHVDEMHASAALPKLLRRARSW
jgi:phosphoglycerate dehydrogenase-like enzyme